MSEREKNKGSAQDGGDPGLADNSVATQSNGGSAWPADNARERERGIRKREIEIKDREIESKREKK